MGGRVVTESCYASMDGTGLNIAELSTCQHNKYGQIDEPEMEDQRARSSQLNGEVDNVGGR